MVRKDEQLGPILGFDQLCVNVKEIILILNKNPLI